MNIVFSLIAVLLLIIIPIIGINFKLDYLFGIILPYTAIFTFITGIIYHVIKWAKVPVPFHIPTVTGQQKSLPWIKNSKLESPHSTLGVIGRMALEILFFRSLFRNTKSGIKNGPNLIYGSSKYLWLWAMAFHWSILIIFLRHFRFFTEPIPFFVSAVQNIDGFLQIGLPVLFFTDILIITALLYLFFRRIIDLRIKYISLAADYFPLLLIFSIAGTGILMRYFYKVDLIKVKELVIGLFAFQPEIPEGVGVMFFIHLFLVCMLLAYFPFSKLLHMPGIFLSPTRNLANNSRMKRHVNPWNRSVMVHTYEEYEDEFREKMRDAGLPLEKE